MNLTDKVLDHIAGIVTQNEPAPSNLSMARKFGVSESAVAGALRTLERLREWQDEPRLVTKVVGRNRCFGIRLNGVLRWSQWGPVPCRMAERHERVLDILLEYVGKQAPSTMDLAERLGMEKKIVFNSIHALKAEQRVRRLMDNNAQTQIYMVRRSISHDWLETLEGPCHPGAGGGKMKDHTPTCRQRRESALAADGRMCPLCKIHFRTDANGAVLARKHQIPCPSRGCPCGDKVPTHVDAAPDHSLTGSTSLWCIEG